MHKIAAKTLLWPALPRVVKRSLPPVEWSSEQGCATCQHRLEPTTAQRDKIMLMWSVEHRPMHMGWQFHKTSS